MYKALSRLPLGQGDCAIEKRTKRSVKKTDDLLFCHLCPQTESLVQGDRFMADIFAESMKYPEISNISVIYCRDNKQVMVANIN